MTVQSPLGQTGGLEDIANRRVVETLDAEEPHRFFNNVSASSDSFVCHNFLINIIPTGRFIKAVILLFVNAFFGFNENTQRNRISLFGQRTGLFDFL